MSFAGNKAPSKFFVRLHLVFTSIHVCVECIAVKISLFFHPNNTSGLRLIQVQLAINKTSYIGTSFAPIQTILQAEDDI
jgi:hypothetical protein